MLVLNKKEKELIEKGKEVDGALTLFKKGKVVIVRWPRLMNQLTGSFLGSAIFEKIRYYCKMKNKKNSKLSAFTAPCSNKYYEREKSLCEIFGVSQFQFNMALKRFAYKLGKTHNKIKKKDALVIYHWERKCDKTYYEVNWDLYYRKLGELSAKEDVDYANYLKNKKHS